MKITPQYVCDEVTRIIELGRRDPEAAHSDEDKLHWTLVLAYCPDDLVAEITRLKAADFERWCA